jgi:hypothetical protein
MSSTGGSSSAKLCDRNLGGTAVENSYGREPNPWIELEFKRHRIRLERWFIAQDSDHFLRNWRIQGSNDGVTYTTIHEYRDDQTINSGARHAFFTVNESPSFWKRIRLYLTGASHAGQANFDITQLELYGWILREGQEL